MELVCLAPTITSLKFLKYGFFYGCLLYYISSKFVLFYVTIEFGRKKFDLSPVAIRMDERWDFECGVRL